MNVELSYHMNGVAFVTDTVEGYWYPGPPVSSYTHRSKGIYDITQHNFELSAGPSFYLKQFYLRPTFAFSYVLIVTKSDLQTEDDYGATSTVDHKTDKWREFGFSFGGGLGLGYELKLGKLKSFLELKTGVSLGSSYFKKYLNESSFVVGIRF